MHSVRAGAQPEESPRDNEVRRQVNEALAAVGPLLLAASRAADGPTPKDAVPALRSAALALLSATF